MELVRACPLLVIAAVLLPVRSASACSALVCPPSTFLPAAAANADELPVVPENGAVLAIDAWSRELESRTIVATRVRGEVMETIELVVEDGVVRLVGALEGDVWTVTESHVCAGGYESSEASTTVRVGPRAAEPTAFGSVFALPPSRAEIVVPDSSGPCASPIDSVAIEVGVTPDASVMPWRDLLRIETLVDGAPFPVSRRLGTSGPGSMVFVACEEPTTGQLVPELEEGTHLVQQRAFLPGSDVPLESDEIEIELHCDLRNAGVPPASPEIGVCSVSAPGTSGTTRTRGIAAITIALTALALATTRRRRQHR